MAKAGDFGDRRGEGGNVESDIIGALVVVASPMTVGGVRLFVPLLGEGSESHRGPATAGETGVMGKRRSKRQSSKGRDSRGELQGGSTTAWLAKVSSGCGVLP